MVLDHVRKQIAEKLYPEITDEVLLAAKYNTYQVNERVQNMPKTAFSVLILIRI